ncbi:hypothetical protein [Bacteroides acidifaciens]|uniref:hypothetical protein n=1 Tax=Bacteroides acidifaciens TaxID=85831 RepID=UPI0025AE1B7B|nr:hypothetical protein [Bacteroides acidifaciens]
MLTISNINRLLIVIFVICCACSLYSTNIGCDKNPERIEADSFLADMPDKLQERQEKLSARQYPVKAACSIM